MSWTSGMQGLRMCTVILAVGAAARCAFAAEARATQFDTRSVEILVTETAGIRRFGYPVHAQVPAAEGQLDGAQHVRLLHGNQEIAAQIGVAERWEDGSVKWLTVDWNTSLAPLAQERFRLQHGPMVRANRVPRGLKVTETAEAFEVGLFRFRKDGAPLIESCTHAGSENIAPGRNGPVVTDEEGNEYDFASAAEVEAEMVKRGPVHVTMRYRGRWSNGQDSSASFVTELAVPNSKSWWKVTHRVTAADRRLRKISLHTPFRMGGPPLVWDFGTGSWTYGALRDADDVALLEQIVAPSRGTAAAPWKVFLGGHEALSLYETAATRRPPVAEGWGHLSDGRRVVAFAMAEFGQRPGAYRMSVSGDGACEVSFEPSDLHRELTLTVYQHFVGVPVQIGAATSPPSMLNPLVARCHKSYYERCGVPVPDGTNDQG